MPATNPTILDMSHACLHAAGSALSCLGQAFPVLCASSHRVRSALLVGGLETFCEAESIDQAVVFASGWLVWLACTARWQWEYLVARWRYRLITAVSLSVLILWLVNAACME